MKLSMANAEIFVPDSMESSKALERTTHMAIAAHQDDIEILAIPGILECFQRQDKWFTGVTVTDGRGSPRNGDYASYSDEQMRLVRIKEQKKAALVGEYAAQVFLDYPSSAIKSKEDDKAEIDMANLISLARPKILYTHNLADKHDTHIGVAMKVIRAIRRIDRKYRPQKLYGCEVWRDLDWMLDQDKVSFDCSSNPNLQAALLGVFDSQIAGGKRYDLATMGRRQAHATYSASHGVDKSQGLVFAMDMTSLLEDDRLEINNFIASIMNKFIEDVQTRIRKM